MESRRGLDSGCLSFTLYKVAVSENHVLSEDVSFAVLLPPFLSVRSHSLAKPQSRYVAQTRLISN